MSDEEESWEPKWDPTRWNPIGSRLTPVSIKVQGITVKPGEKILVLKQNGETVLHTFSGKSSNGYWTDAPMTTAEGHGPGPYRLKDFRHPDILTGLATELDKGS